MEYKGLVEKLLLYHFEGGRFSYYPLISKWNNRITNTNRLEEFEKISSEKDEIDLYIHIPFCESLCTFCGCNIKVTKDESHHRSYLDSLLAEVSTYKEIIANKQVSNIFIGGGTPNALSENSLDYLFTSLSNKLNLASDLRITMEADPRLMTKDKLEVLKKSKVYRIHYGIQDFNKEVLGNINRHQDVDSIKEIIALTKEFGIEVSIDLIYGLPHQNSETLKQTIDVIKELPIGHVAYYPLANAPWLKKAQQAYGRFEPVELRTKYQLYLEGLDLLNDLGFKHIGLGHLIHKDSPLLSSYNKGELKRNMTGPTERKNSLMLGLGVSSISSLDGIFFQNDKVVDKYEHLVNTKGMAHLKSHIQSDVERTVEKRISNIFCTGKIENSDFNNLPKDYQELFLKEGFIRESEKNYVVSDLGQIFLKSILKSFELA